jgi:uncharacterized protein (DUF433 family)
MTLPDFLTADEHGGINLAGHRISLAYFVRLYKQGYSAEAIALEFDTLPLALVHKTIAFYLENHSEVDAYVDAAEEEVRRQAAASNPNPTLAELRRRFEQITKQKAS